MPGSIVGIYGKQRSGKTLIAYKITKALREAAKEQGYDLRVYTNLYCPEDDWIYVNCLDDLPLDLEPKIVLIDEIYNGCDAEDHKKLNEISIFVNTIGKQNCLFIFTSIYPKMVYNRLRQQINTAILVKSSGDYIHYKVMNVNTGVESDYCVQKTERLFRDVKYDTNFIPLDFNWSMKAWKSKLSKFYMDNYGISISL